MSDQCFSGFFSHDQLDEAEAKHFRRENGAASGLKVCQHISVDVPPAGPLPVVHPHSAP